MEWALIIEMIIEAIMECRENRDRADVEAGLRNPGLRETIAMRRALRSEGFHGRDLREAMNEGVATLREMPPAEITALMDAVEARRAASAPAPE